MPRVLVVDDDENLLLLAEKRLAEAMSGFNVISATSASEALLNLAKEEIDAIVSDYKMPGMDGLEFLRKIRSQGCDIPFIMFTGKGREEIAIEALNLGANYYLKKEGKSGSLYRELAHILRQLVEHRKTEQCLQQARTQAQKYLDIASVILIALNRDGIVTMINRKGCAVLGYSEEEIIGKKWFETFLPEEMQEATRAVFNDLMEGKIEPAEYFENPIITKNGSERLIAWHNTVLIENGNIIGTLSSGDDITERKQAEIALSESQMRFRRFSEASFEGIIIHDKGVILDANHVYAKKLGYEVSEVIGKNGLEHAAPKCRQAIVENFRSGFEEPFETIALKKDGSMFPVEIHAKNVEYNGKTVRVAASRDLTQQKQIQLELERSKAQFQQTFQAIPNPAYLYQQLPDGQIILCAVNKAALEISQGQVAFCVNHDLEDPVLSDSFSPMLQKHGVDLWQVAINVRGVFASGKPLRVEKAFKLPSGEDRYFLLDYVPTSGDTVLIVSTDVTERQQRAEELSEFAHTMAHDLRNPLLSIEGYADLLLSEYDEKAAKRISRLAQRVQNLLQRSIALAEAGKIINASLSVDLMLIVREVAETTIPADINIYCDELPAVRGDQVKLAQIFQNLFENAVYHGEPQKIEVRRRDSEGTIHLLVINDGKVIPFELRDAIFHPGHTTKNGGGLGLAIVRKLVEAHGWEIHLDTSPETTFRISIPS
ncbi:MAG: PAS domain S-box protein [Candidatus Heimdallarchaeota archaeon]